MAATLISVAITSMQNNYMFLFVVSAVVYSYEAPYAITLNTIIQFHMLICNINDLSLTTTTLSTALSESKCSFYSSRAELINDSQTIQNYIQQTGNAHQIINTL